MASSKGLGKERFDKIDLKITHWMYKHGKGALRASLAVIFIWFGVLKLTGQSPAEDLIAHTVYWMDPENFLPILGWWEIIIGISLLYRPMLRLGILLLFLLMAGTFLPLLLLPGVCFKEFPFVLTMEGQYIVKNLIIISAGLVVGGTARD